MGWIGRLLFGTKKQPYVSRLGLQRVGVPVRRTTTEAERIAEWAQERLAGRGERLPNVRPHVASALVRRRSRAELETISTELTARLWLSHLELQLMIEDTDPARRRQSAIAVERRAQSDRLDDLEAELLGPQFTR